MYNRKYKHKRAHKCNKLKETHATNEEALDLPKHCCGNIYIVSLNAQDVMLGEVPSMILIDALMFMRL